MIPEKKNEFSAKDAQSVDEGGHVHEEARALRAHHEEHEERRSCERGAGFAAAIPHQVRAAKHQFGGQQGATVDRQVSERILFSFPDSDTSLFLVRLESVSSRLQQ